MESADMRDLGSRGEIRTGSSPVARTKKTYLQEVYEGEMNGTSINH